MSGLGGTDPTGEVGFWTYVDGGRYTVIGGDGYGTWAGVALLYHATQIDISARSYDGWVAGSAVGYLWS